MVAEKKLQKRSKKDDVVKEAPKAVARGKKEIVGIANIYSSYNNIIVNITDAAGNTIAKSSGGKVTKYDRLEASPTVAMFVAKNAAQEALEKGITAVHVKIRAPGGHRGPTIPGPCSQAAL